MLRSVGRFIVVGSVSFIRLTFELTAALLLDFVRRQQIDFADLSVIGEAQRLKQEQLHGRSSESRDNSAGDIRCLLCIFV